LKEDQDLVYFIFAKEFGWTPEEVDNIPYKLLRKLLLWIQIDYEEQDFNIRKALKKKW